MKRTVADLSQSVSQLVWTLQQVGIYQFLIRVEIRLGNSKMNIAEQTTLDAHK